MNTMLAHLGICSGVMTLIALLFAAPDIALKPIWRPQRRYALWIAVVIGFLTPVKPRFGAVCTVPIGEGNPVAAQHAGNPGRIGPDLGALLFAIWLAGFLGRLLFYAVRQNRFQKYAETHSRPAADRVRLSAKKTAAEMKIANVTVRILPGLPGPIMTGILTATIYLPHEAYAEEELRLILKHELTHFRHRDVLFKGLLLLARAVHWFNPLMGLIERRFNEAAELACDAAAMAGETAENKKRYCGAILQAVHTQNQTAMNDTPVLAGAFGSGGRDLRRRLEMILSPKAKKKLGGVSLLLIAMILFSGTVIGVTGETAEGASSATATDVYAPERETTTAIAGAEVSEPTTITTPEQPGEISETTTVETVFPDAPAQVATTYTQPVSVDETDQFLTTTVTVTFPYP